MKSLASVLSIIALGFVLVGCPSSGGGGGGDSTQAFAVSTTAADFGVVGNAYTSTIGTTGGTAPFTWTLFGGVLPTGLSLNAGTGVVSGTPTAVENPTAVFTVTDSTGKTATGSVLFAVHPRTDRASVTGSGTAGSGASSTPSMNSDGSLVAFVSQSTNFVTTVSGSQIYAHNRQTNQIEVVSRDSDSSVINEGGGTSSDPSMSSDGRLVAFVSLSSNLVTSVSGQQIYVRDRETGQTTVISKSSAGIIGDGTSSAPAISADGRYVAFASASTNLVAGVSGIQIYVHDRQTDQTTLISKDNTVTPVPGNGVSATPAISATGQFVAFASLSTNLGAAGGNQQIYIHDRLTGANGTTSLVSKDSVPTAGNGNSSTPSVSGDGRFVAFVSGATNIVTGFSGQQVYVHDRNTGANGTNSLISRDNSGVPNAGNQSSSAPSISSDGRYVAFTSLATNLETGVSGQQIYRHDRNGPTTNLVSRDNTGSPVEGNASSETPSISGNGGFVAFASQASNLLAGGVAPSDIYIRALP
ncbi:MAG: PD40 domain-containing protein [Nitrospiraceae bacterium]|nr:PD40 domain-containing protein [Nitrospiraceae bacterium]